jgi:hypothetical protein
MNLSLDQLRELVFDYNSEFLIQYYENVIAQNDRYFCNKGSSEFIQIILNNISFEETEEDDDEYFSE